MYPFRNLAFQGGGSKALAYHGAIRVLESEGLLAPIERVAGTSAGAALAAMLSLRLDVAEIINVYRSFDVDFFIEALSGHLHDHNASQRFLQREMERLQGSFSSLSRLATRYGWNSLEYLHVWTQDLLAKYCNGDRRATFSQFRTWGYRDLYVVATNVTRRRTEIFSADTTPDVAVADALIMSQAIPLFFEGLQFDGKQFGQGDHYADGGMTLNYPLVIFDEAPFDHDNRWFVNGVNWESLGCRLYRPSECAVEHEPATNLLNYIQSTFETLVEAQALAYELSATSQLRTINISDCSVRTTDFSVRPDPDNELYQQLVHAGEAATYAYLANYDPPLIRPLLPVSHYVDKVWHAIKQWPSRRRTRSERS